MLLSEVTVCARVPLLCQVTTVPTVTVSNLMLKALSTMSIDGLEPDVPELVGLVTAVVPSPFPLQAATLHAKTSAASATSEIVRDANIGTSLHVSRHVLRSE